MAEKNEPDLADNFGNINIGAPEEEEEETPLVKEQDFQEFFAHALKYGKQRELWQEKRRTILLYKLGDNWRKLKNKPGIHAEIRLIDSIKIDGNFYLHMLEENRQGLRNLRQSGVELEPVIGVAMWKRFLWANRVPDEEQWKWFEVACSDERQAREELDKQIFGDL